MNSNNTVYADIDYLRLQADKLFSKYVSCLASIADEIDRYGQSAELDRYHKLVDQATTKVSESIDILELALTYTERT